jgi:methyl-accepting chemotaxis protein
MRITIGFKIGAGFFLVTLMLVMAGMVGYMGAQKLGHSIDYFSKSAWPSMDGASSLVSSLEHQASTIEEVTSAFIPASSEQIADLEKSREAAKTAMDQLFSSGIATEEQTADIKNYFSDYDGALQAILDGHRRYAETRNSAFSQLAEFEEFLKVLEFYSNNIYRLPNVDQNDKFALITRFFKTKLALQTRFYYMQRFLGGEDAETMLAQMESAWEKLSDEAYELSDLELTTAVIRDGKFDGKDYASVLMASIEVHKKLFDELAAAYQSFETINLNYTNTKDLTLVRVNSVVGNIGGVIAEETAQAAATKSGVLTTVVFAILAGVAIAVAATIFIGFTVVKPILIAGQRMKQISTGDGDLTLTLPVNGNDEIAYLGRNFNEFVAKIRQIVADNLAIIENLAAAADGLEALSEKTSNATLQQQEQSQQIATALYEMTRSFQEVATNAASAEQVTRDTSSSVKLSQSAVLKNRNSIEHLSEGINLASQSVTRLATESESVGNILGVIRGIAEQTNLLALNAAIEAARAGDQGRGFAVVADEVRTLAQRTQVSTSEIQSLLEGLQNSSREAVSVMKNSQGQAQESVRFAHNVHSELEKVTHGVDEVFRMNAQIATASEEQASVAEDINRNVTQINDLSDQTSQDAKATRSASQEVKDIVKKMRGLVGQFKV